MVYRHAFAHYHVNTSPLDISEGKEVTYIIEQNGAAYSCTFGCSDR